MLADSVFLEKLYECWVYLHLIIIFCRIVPRHFIQIFFLHSFPVGLVEEIVMPETSNEAEQPGILQWHCLGIPCNRKKNFIVYTSN